VQFDASTASIADPHGASARDVRLGDRFIQQPKIQALFLSIFQVRSCLGMFFPFSDFFSYFLFSHALSIFHAICCILELETAISTALAGF